MKEPVLLLTVPHTGTRFMQKLLRDGGLTVGSHIRGYSDIYFEHLTGNYINEIRRVRAMGVRVISPMRELWKIQRSWMRGIRVWPVTLEQSLAYFNELKDLVVNVDNPATRDNELAAVSDLLGVKLSTDWTPVGAKEWQ